MYVRKRKSVRKEAEAEATCRYGGLCATEGLTPVARLTHRRDLGLRWGRTEGEVGGGGRRGALLSSYNISFE